MNHFVYDKDDNAPKAFLNVEGVDSCYYCLLYTSCGANLVLVAGERNLREQHFRIKECFDGICQMPVEGINSIDSKIALKCWLEDKMCIRDRCNR